MKLAIKIKKMMHRAKQLFDVKVKQKAYRLYNRVRFELREQPDLRKRNRTVILAFTLLFFFDYLIYCLHTNSAVFEIFPTLPMLDQQKEITVYLPSLDGSTLFSEKRSIPVYDDDEHTARELFRIVAEGSLYENTAPAVPADLFVKKVWLYGGKKGKGAVCIFDLEPVKLAANVRVVSNSESLFKKALDRTIRGNLLSVEKVLILERGIPVTKLWEH